MAESQPLATNYEIHTVVNVPLGPRWLAAYWDGVQHTFLRVALIAVVGEPAPSEVTLFVGVVFDPATGGFVVANNIEGYCALAVDTTAPFTYPCPNGHVAP
jgi:hypothetical protein